VAGVEAGPINRVAIEGCRDDVYPGGLGEPNGAGCGSVVSVTAEQTSLALEPIRNVIVFPGIGELPFPGSSSVADIVAESWSRVAVSRGQCTTGLTWDPREGSHRPNNGAGQKLPDAQASLRALAPGQAGGALTAWHQADISTRVVRVRPSSVPR
jgi:hypothetical protein